MRYFWTFFWSFLLTEMLTYVVSSMNGAAFDLKLGAIVSVGVTILIYIASAIIPNEPANEHH